MTVGIFPLDVIVVATATEFRVSWVVLACAVFVIVGMVLTGAVFSVNTITAATESCIVWIVCTVAPPGIFGVVRAAAPFFFTGIVVTTTPMMASRIVFTRAVIKAVAEAITDFINLTVAEFEISGVVCAGTPVMIARVVVVASAQISVIWLVVASAVLFTIGTVALSILGISFIVIAEAPVFLPFCATVVFTAAVILIKWVVCAVAPLQSPRLIACKVFVEAATPCMVAWVVGAGAEPVIVRVIVTGAQFQSSIVFRREV